eukprot:jgi/Galph1/20/GphlegSOOS_G4775.1
MAEEEDGHTKDPVPDVVGDGKRRFRVEKTRHLGSGHFGDVYEGVQLSTGKPVAVKLEHRSGSIARKEWEVMRALSGEGTPYVYYTGVAGRYYVMVMDLLGATLQKILETRPSRRLPWDMVSKIGQLCVNLLRTVHSKGYVHGDVKPENFLCAYEEGGHPLQADPSKGLYMIDLGLASKYRDPTRPNGHIAYGQRIDHFSGTVRYASLNAHLGRWLSRRDDIESLCYMLLYLHNGSLPWQGFCGDDKNMLVCEHKGKLPPDEICKGAPECMQYFLAYVRSMKFEEEPDYEYLLMLLDPAKGLIEIHRMLAEDRTLGDVSSANGALETEDDVNNSSYDLASGGKRKRNDFDSGSQLAPNAKKHRIVIPKRYKTHQWMIISTSAKTGNASPATQCYTSHTSYQNLVKEVEKKWSTGMRIVLLSFTAGMWTAVLNQKGTGFQEQALHYCPGADFPRDWVRQKWDEGFFITALAGNATSWGIVCSTMTRNKRYKQQSYIVSPTFPSKWVADKWASGYYITSVATQGSPPHQQWAVVVSRGAPYTDQVVELDFVYPSDVIHTRWDDNYMVTAVASTTEMNAFVMSRGLTFGEEQRCTRTSHGPLHKVREDWNDNLYVTALAWGRVA